jgi:hypothetical protein
LTCRDLAAGTCGPVSDGCGNNLTCDCSGPYDTCGGGGTAGQCGCTPLTPETACLVDGMNCGTFPDLCGGTYNCDC